MATTERIQESALLRTDPKTGSLVSRQYRLVIIKGPDQGKEFLFSEVRCVGTQEDVSIHLSDPSVSRQHLELRPRADGLAIRDLGSTNGTFLGGVRIEQALLESDATFRVGKTELRVEVLEQDLGRPESQTSRFGEAVGASKPMRRVFGMLERVATSSSPVLLLGETGTGKEVLARGLHAASARRQGPFVVFDAGAVTPSLIESELFGHVRGAFTGAVKDKKGLFEAAEGGTLFLDEIGELPVELQAKLLRALENGTIRRVGEERYRSVDVRVVSATHRVLEKDVQSGTFRQDLFFRLAVAVIVVPPLRERQQDIPVLIAKFLQDSGQPHRTLPDDVMTKAAAYPWPGNVRELRNFVARAILGEDFASLGSAEVSPTPTGDKSATLPELSVDVPYKQAKEQLLEVFTRDYIEELLQRHGGNISQAAKAAGLARPYVHKLVQKYNLKAQ